MCSGARSKRMVALLSLWLWLLLLLSNGDVFVKLD